MPADRIFSNCRAYTLDAADSVAQAIAVTGQFVRAVGTAEMVAGHRGPRTEVSDLGGRTVIPGLIDSHNHLIHYGVSATRSADLTGCASTDEMLGRLRAFHQGHPDSPWILGRRFDQELFLGGAWPTRRDLDRLSPGIPIAVTRVCLHALVANSAALEPVRDRLSPKQWETGLLTEEAADLVWAQIPPPTAPELETAAMWALNEARRVGLTGVHVIVSDDAELDLLRRLHAERRLPVRVLLQCPVGMMDRLSDEGIRTGSGDEWLGIGPLKLFMDGSMGARTAAMRAPFADDPGNTGELFMEADHLSGILVEMQRRGFQASIHAIGDLAIETALDGIQLALEHGNESNALRHRIEHASQMSESLVSRMARLNVIAGVQPQFIATDFWTPDRVGPERYRWSYPFRTMLEAGIRLAMGSDCPVEALDPAELIHRAVAREPRSLSECLDVEQAIRAYTQGSAYAAFEEHTKGTLEAGRLADFVVLSDDPFEVGSSHLGELRAEMTVLGGLQQ